MIMTDTLQWTLPGVRFENGSLFADDWRKIDETGEWHWQYDTHELTFEIYEYDGQFWKLYLLRFLPDDATDYVYGFGGQACRMALVRYQQKAKSPHSSKLYEAGDEEWVRTYEVDPDIHEVIKSGREDPKYGVPFGGRRAA